MISDLISLSETISVIYQRHRSHLLINGDDISRKIELLRTNVCKYGNVIPEILPKLAKVIHREVLFVSI